jgi:O-antigen biosynthesis protein WbqP
VARSNQFEARAARNGREMKRFLDVVLCVVGLIILFIPMVLIAVFIKLTSKGPIFYCSVRVGRNNQLFNMIKFRSMRVNTPVVATHLLQNPTAMLTPIGSFMRKTSLDELPQFLNILTGDMTFVGPRPALFNQDDLIALRTELGVHTLKPGLTGWAQINGRDEITIENKVKFDAEYLSRYSLAFDLQILWRTALKVLHKDGISH